METAVFVDGEPVATDERLSTPNRFVLIRQLTPGVHTLTLCVDNRLKYPMDQWTHGTSEYTQTNWNGIVGRIELVAKPSCHIGKMDLYPNVEEKRVKVRLDVRFVGESVKGVIVYQIRERGGKEVCCMAVPISLSGKNGKVE